MNRSLERLPETPTPSADQTRSLSRRRFLRFLGTGVGVLAAPVLSGCARAVSGAEPTIATPAAVFTAIREPIIDNQLFDESTAPVLIKARRSQQARTCRELVVFGHPDQSVKNSQIIAFFLAFPDQAQGLDAYNGSSKYYDLLSGDLELVIKFAKREVDMNLAWNIRREPVIMSKPLFGGYNNSKQQVNDEAVNLPRIAEEVQKLSVKGLDLLLIILVNPDLEPYEMIPFPGYSSGRYNRFSTGLIPSTIFQPRERNFGATTIAHEDLYHGLLGNPSHNDDPDNPRPNPNSVARSSGSIAANLMDLELDDWDIRGLCQNPPQLTRRAVLPAMFKGFRH